MTLKVTKTTKDYNLSKPNILKLPEELIVKIHCCFFDKNQFSHFSSTCTQLQSLLPRIINHTNSYSLLNYFFMRDLYNNHDFMLASQKLALDIFHEKNNHDALIEEVCNAVKEGYSKYNIDANNRNFPIYCNAAINGIRNHFNFCFSNQQNAEKALAPIITKLKNVIRVEMIDAFVRLPAESITLDSFCDKANALFFTYYPKKFSFSQVELYLRNALRKKHAEAFKTLAAQYSDQDLLNPHVLCIQNQLEKEGLQSSNAVDVAKKKAMQMSKFYTEMQKEVTQENKGELHFRLYRIGSLFIKETPEFGPQIKSIYYPFAQAYINAGTANKTNAHSCIFQV